jgi:hypothetical protein
MPRGFPNSSAVSNERDNAPEPHVEVEGLNSEIEPFPAEAQIQAVTAPKRINLETNASVKDLLDMSMSAVRPEIIASVEMSEFSDAPLVLSLLDSRRFEAGLRYAQIESGFKAIQDQDPDGIYTELTEEQIQEADKLTSEIESLRTVRYAIDEVVKVLNLRGNSETLMASAKDILSEGLDPDEAASTTFPSTVDELLESWCGFQGQTVRAFSNSKTYATLLRELSSAITGVYPTMIDHGQHRTDPGATRLSSRHIAPPGQRHQLDCAHIGNRSGIKSPMGAGTGNTAGGNISSGPLTGLDRALVLATLLSNELTVSAGIGRLSGMPIGNRFGVTQENPVLGALGISTSVSNIDITSMTTKPGSLADFIVLNETQNNAQRTVLPFEAAPVRASGKTLTSGADFFVEGPLRFPGGNHVDSYMSYASKLSDTTQDVSNYLEELLALGEKEMPLTPQGVLVRCLSELHKVASFMSETFESGNIPRVTYTSAALYANCSSNTSATYRARTAVGQVSARESLLGVTLRFREEFDQQLTDKSYVPNRTQAGDLGASQNDIEAIFDMARGNALEWQLANIGSSVSAQTITTNVTAAKGWTKTGKFAPVGNMRSADNPDDMSLMESPVQIARELQREAMNLAQREKSSASYLDASGYTRFNKWDDNMIVAVVQEILMSLSSHFFKIYYQTNHPYGYRRTLTAAHSPRCTIAWHPPSFRKLRDFLESLILTTQSGVALDTMWLDSGESASVPSVTRTTSFLGKGAQKVVADELTSMMTSAINHRKFIKMIVSLLKATGNEILRASDLSSQVYSALSDPEVTQKEDSELTSDVHEALVRLAKSPSGRQSLKYLTPDQTSLKLVDKMRSDPNSLTAAQLESDLILTPAQRLAVNNFAAGPHVADITYPGDGIVLSVGLPVGMMRALRRPVLDGDGGASVDFADPDASGVSIRVHRVSELHTGLSSWTPLEFQFDTELFLLPDSIRVSEEIQGVNQGALSLQIIVDTSVWYRIRSGRIISANLGADLRKEDPSVAPILNNHMKSHLYELMIYEVSGLPLNEKNFLFQGNLLNPMLDKETRDRLSKLLGKDEIAELLDITGTTFNRIFVQERVNGVDYLKCQTGSTLSHMLRSRWERTRNEFGTTITTRKPPEIKKDSLRAGLMLSKSSLLTPRLRRERVLSPSQFDRIFNIMIESRDYAGFAQRHTQWQVRQHYYKNWMKGDINGYYCEVDLVG